MRSLNLSCALSVAILLPACRGSEGPIADPGAVPLGAWSAVHAAERCPTSTCIYVTNSTEYTASVTVYPANANGNVSPYRTITGSNTGLKDPTGVTLDKVGRIYVANYSGSSLLVFAATADGNVSPLRSIAGSQSGLVDPVGVALDTRHNIYTTNQLDRLPKLGADILAYKPRAQGDATPIRVIRGSHSEMTSTAGIAIDTTGNLYVTNYRNCNQQNHCRGRNSVLVFAPGANGNVAPIRMIVGSNTMLSKGGIGGIAVDDAGDTYVGGGSSVLVYAAGANGNVAPIQNIAGSKTGLTGGGQNGVAVDSQRNIYVTSYQHNTVTVFAAGATGNVTPMRTIYGSNTGLVLPFGITVH
jgi:Lactonase, 7-bladed beta-propeller